MTERKDALTPLFYDGAARQFVYHVNSEPPVTILIGPAGSVFASYVQGDDVRTMETFDPVMVRAFGAMLERAMINGATRERNHPNERIDDLFAQHDTAPLDSGPWKITPFA